MVVYMDASELVLSFYRSIEAREPLTTVWFAENAETIEHPNAIKPNGARSPLADMIADSAKGADLLARQRYDVHSMLQVDNVVITRLTWTGVVAATIGPFREGQTLTAHIAQFITVGDHRIRSIETYDCYEPFD